MSKNKRNPGIQNLNNLNVEEVAAKASFQNNKKEIKKTQADKVKLHQKQIYIPAFVMDALVGGKEDGKIVGSVSSFIVEATRRRLVEEGLL
jgi:hypothetical protein